MVINICYIYMLKQILIIARGYPRLVLLVSIIMYMYTQNIDFIFLTVAIVTSDIFNGFLKHYLFKPIMGNKKWPILGFGKRPSGAKNCGVMAQSPPIKSKSYGMPSGHASTALFFSTYLIRHLLDSNFKKNVEIIGILILSVMGLGIMYSRVYLKCHTIQQVILGGLLGATFGSMYYTNKEVVKNIFNI